MTTQDLMGYVQNVSNELIQTYPSLKQKKAIIAFQRFNEYLFRLENRYSELKDWENILLNYDEDESFKTIPLHDVQLIFLDKTEGFHQQLYATLSAYILLLNHVCDKNLASQIPIRNVTSFLKYVQSKWNNDLQLNKQVEILTSSINFRSKFIDHPQQHILHDWMTMPHGHGICIIYFIRNENDNVYFIDWTINPYDKNFKPPVDCSEFYVSPEKNITFDALKDFSVCVLNHIRQ